MLRAGCVPVMSCTVAMTMMYFKHFSSMYGHDDDIKRTTESPTEAATPDLIETMKLLVFCDVDKR